MKLVLALLLATAALAKPTVYFIRHGEKPGGDANGLSDQGEERAQCLRNVFGKDSGYDIGYIMAQGYKASGARIRPYQTVVPLAADLGLTVDTSCDRDDPACVKKKVKNYEGKGNILICWEHKRLSDIADELGASNVDAYPDDRYDLIWTDPAPYDEITAVTSEKCPGLD